MHAYIFSLHIGRVVYIEEFTFVILIDIYRQLYMYTH